MAPRGTSRAWLRAAFALDATGTAATSARLPPVFLCPAVSTSLPYSTLSRPVNSPARPWRQRPLCEHTRMQQVRRGMADVAASADQAAPDGADIPLTTTTEPSALDAELAKKLPLQCPGCGAFSQIAKADQPGFYDLTDKSTKAFLGLTGPNAQKQTAKEKLKKRRSEEARIVAEAVERLEQQDGSIDPQLAHLAKDGLAREAAEGEEEEKADEDVAAAKAASMGGSVLCARCHDLLHHSRGQPVFHPDLDAIRATLAESPYKYNHVYHVLDAADFPMSLLPRIHELLDTMPLRSRNRRARHSRFYGGRCTEMSFVVTRADLLAPRKEQVDKLLSWMREVLREALGRAGRNVRLGNVHLVSARRGWWTGALREEIWKRGGAHWLVGKANVGKSYLVHHVFPKGRMNAGKNRGAKQQQQQGLPAIQMHQTGGEAGEAGKAGEVASYAMDPMQQTALLDRGDGGPPEAIADFDVDLERALDETALLPPRPRETNFPAMPVVSALAGTTASPIRIPYGGGKGELIDLPGLARSGLADFVDPAQRDALVLKTRNASPEQIVLKGGERRSQSLLLGGGLIRITPRPLPGDDYDQLVFLACNFTPLPAHRTATHKAVELQAGTSTVRVPRMVAEGAGQHMRLAGSFALKHDVTKVRAGPITRRDAIGLRVDKLPYRVMAVDILIEGCGWVEIAAQVRTKHLFRETKSAEAPAKEPTSTTTATTTSQNGILQTLDLSAPLPEDLDDGKKGKKKKTKAVSTATASDNDWGDDETTDNDSKDSLNWPIVDVYSPEGKFVAVRRPLNAWMLAQPRGATRRKRQRARPKKSMKGAKKAAKAAARRENWYE